MPTLLLFAACEKIILDQNSVVSLISIIEELKVQVITNIPVQAGALAPIQWGVLSYWEQTSAWDQDREFEQRVALIADSGETLLENITPFKFIKPRHRTINNMIGMPISQPGPHKLKLWIRDKSDPPKQWKEIATYPLTIDLVVVQPEPPVAKVH